MGDNNCKDCERDFPGGKGLIDGRCPSCYAIFEEKERRLEQPTPAEPPEGGQGE